MVGSWSSITVTDCVQFTVLPVSSAIIHVTTVVPTGKVSGASLVMVNMSAEVQLSVATGIPRSTLEAEQSPASATRSVRSLAQLVITGASVSGAKFTVMV